MGASPLQLAAPAALARSGSSRERMHGAPMPRARAVLVTSLISASRSVRGTNTTMSPTTLCRFALIVAVSLFLPGCSSSAKSRQPRGAAAHAASATSPTTNPFKRRDPAPPIVGRWDVTVRSGDPGADAPSWFEVRQSGYRTLVGDYVGRVGSARPIGRVEWNDAGSTFRFAVPPQWERRLDDVVFTGKLLDDGNVARGETTDEKGRRLQFEARRAPALCRDLRSTAPPQWAAPIELFNGRDLSGWKTRWPEKTNSWLAKGGLLVNTRSGNDLLTDRTFVDFKLVAEFRFPPRSNSGIYLRGRYEAQLEDTAGREPENHIMGSIYGFLTPAVNAAKPAGE